MLGAYYLLKLIESELQAYLSATEGRVFNFSIHPFLSNPPDYIFHICTSGENGVVLQEGFMNNYGRCLALIQAASDGQEQGGVHDSDHFLHAIRDLLKIYSNTQAALSTYVSAPGIVQQISGLHSDLMTLQSDLDNSLPEERNRCINELCNLIQSMQQLLFASSTTAQPILTPRGWEVVNQGCLIKRFSHSKELYSVVLDSPLVCYTLLFRIVIQSIPMKVLSACLLKTKNDITQYSTYITWESSSIKGENEGQPLMKELDEMEKINAKLSVAVEEVTLEHVKKNEIVKHHSQEIGLQRRVFVDFFCNPERLRSQVRELTARVRALQIS
ncbi:HAUS augmin-like protein complex subunit 3-like protein [Trifolium pratense]|uniref:HAUS augmin-like protein complex subunit 3-like protein n=2 Tax=Trifolium pratense TaxID=57577 RepID=A0A2K3PAT8_TRIPR|nr:HAUS augmin-like protein complex subunit 3-like protein [Trifolium pratense]